MTTASVIKFGTDGWRGLIARDFTFENVARCAQGIATYLQQQGTASQGLVVGYDTRFGSRQFAECVAEVAVGNGIPVFLADRPAPTPVVSYQVLERKAAGAAMVTASHNPSLWNGIKFKPPYAGSATTEVTDALEANIHAQSNEAPRFMSLVDASEKGLLQDCNPMPDYLAHLNTLLDLSAITSAGLRIQVDNMYGAGSGYFSTLLGEGVTSVSEMHAEVNPAFPGMGQPEPIDKNLGELAVAVPINRADVGIALDGDADRLGVVDEKGVFLTPLHTFALLALYLLEVEGKRGTLIKSLTNTAMTYRLGEQYGVDVHETRVGFKYISPLMMQPEALIGGEESGGYGFRDHIPERDGVLSGLYFLSLMAKLGKRPSELVDYLHSRVGPHYYDRLDAPFSPADRSTILQKLESESIDRLAGLQVIGSDSIDGRRYLFDNAWVVVRFSGTEPLLRIYAEAESPEKVQEILKGTAGFLGI